MGKCKQSRSRWQSSATLAFGISVAATNLAAGTDTFNFSGAADGAYNVAIDRHVAVGTASGASACVSPLSSTENLPITVTGGSGSGSVTLANGNCEEFTITPPADVTIDNVACVYAGGSTAATFAYPAPGRVVAVAVAVFPNVTLDGTITCTVSATSTSGPSGGDDRSAAEIAIENTQSSIAGHIIAAGPTTRYLSGRFDGAVSPTANITSQNAQIFSGGTVGDLNYWFDLQGTRESFESNDREGYYTSFAVGVDTEIGNSDTLAGIMVSIDRYSASEDTTGFDAEVDGVMFGPYVAHRLGENLFLDGKILYGKADYAIDPDGASLGKFEADRILATIRLNGNFEVSDWLMDTYGEFATYRSKSESYTDATSTPIESVTYNETRAVLGLRSYYEGFGSDFTPFVGLEASAHVSGDSSTLVDDDFRGTTSAGFDYSLGAGSFLRGELGYGGIGVDDYETVDARFELRLNF
ncbi:autotransporter outer membrane beta-barrel domain-containing protein [Yoonia sp. R2-816]|uniref:autotransporter outer membrane beta-barrel domain-containing protein n=1 Tax=Yoonia sp. R2-816 TaxID=3342638 RepID=UPI00372A3DBA